MKRSVSVDGAEIIFFNEAWAERHSPIEDAPPSVDEPTPATSVHGNGVHTPSIHQSFTQIESSGTIPRVPRNGSTINGRVPADTQAVPSSASHKQVKDNPYGLTQDQLGAALQTKNGWMAQARCAYSDVDQDVFFSSGKEIPAIRQPRIREAKRICAECVVIDECLEYSLDLHEKQDGIEGVFAGLDEPERKKLIRNKRPKTTPAAE